MHKKNVINLFLKIIIIFVVVFFNLQNISKVFAADELTFYNHNTKSNVNYSGKIITFIYNNQKLTLDYPGIIINGTAFADCEELFVDKLGLSATISDNKIILSDADSNEIIFTIGSKTVKINGKSDKISSAPVKLEFEDGIIKYYVPTRFVSESFGYTYVWDSKNSEIRLIKTCEFEINNKTILYNNPFYSITYENKINNSNIPVVIYNGIAYAPAKLLFEALECQYTEDEKINITKGNIVLQMEKNSYFIYMNDIPFELDAPPIYISNLDEFKNTLFIPLEKCLTLLGFTVNFNENAGAYDILQTEYTGNPEKHPDFKKFYNTLKICIEQKPIDTFFTWNTIENKNSNQKVLTKVKAYSINNADVLELYGVRRADVYDYIDTRALVFELNSISSNLNERFFANFEVEHLNYAMITNVNQHTKIFMMIPEDDKWLFEETEECLRIYFTSEEFTIKDLKHYEEKIVKNIPEIKTPLYPENQLIISIPAGVNRDSINIIDNYYDKNLQIKISGDHTVFYNDEKIINPYEYVTDIKADYNIETNQTILNCSTKFICGYEVVFNNNYLALRIDRPDEIYNKIVVFDAGHGGKDPGAVNQNIYEKNINLSIINYTKDYFENSDIKVYYTRTSDKFLSLEERTNFVKDVHADLFISLHMNSSVLEEAKGTEVFYSKANNNETYYGLTSKKMAQILANKLHIAMDSNLRGTSKSDYYVVQYNSVPAVLIELGFISNTNEVAKLTDKNYQQKAAKAIYESVIEIFSAYPTGR